MTKVTKDQKRRPKCYHENRMQYDEFENEETGEIVCMDYEVCKDCDAVILNDKIMGYV